MALPNWAEQVNNKLNKMNNPAQKMDMEDWKKRSIYKLTTSITDLNKKAYIPRAVSFGPYHHGEDHLLPMEEHKERALLHFLKRSNKNLQLLIDCLKKEVEDLKSAYVMLPKKWQEDDNAFIKLMILDGCFMLEILRNNEKSLDGYAENDPIFGTQGVIRLTRRMKCDMSMLENQLPMLVLEKLLAFESTEPKDDEYLNKLILEFINPTNISVESAVLGKCLHVLDVIRKYLLRGEHGIRSNVHVIIPSATELNLAGIQFRKSETAACLADISFNGGTLNLPHIVVDDDTESMFLNLMAFERYHIGTGNPDISSYIYFMDYIIVTEKDVALLKSRKIVENFMGSDQDVVQLFKSLAKETLPDTNSKLNKVLVNVKEHCDKPWIAWRRNLSRTVEYFRNRWAFLSLVAAVCLFAFAIAQTFYAVYSYYKNDSPPTPPPHPMIPSPPPVISRRLSSYRHHITCF